MPVSSIAAGKIITINGQQFVKIRSDQAKGSQFLAVAPLTYCATKASVGTMQSWNGCGALTTPTGTNFTQGPCLTDSRDGKVYEIRKFSDGSCWMVDNLMYGGGSDGVSDYCTGKASFRSADLMAGVTPSNTSGLNPVNGTRNTLIGDCLDPRAVNSNYCTVGSTHCGYYYNWPAVVQSTDAWQGNTFQPSQPTQGICPVGWHVPNGTFNGDFASVYYATAQEGTFWITSGSWRGMFAGIADSFGVVSNRGTAAFYYSSNQNSPTQIDFMLFGAGANVYPWGGDGSKSNGQTLRCVKDYSCPANCTTCSNIATCKTCSAGYLKSGSACVLASSVVSNCTASNGTACTACASGYTLSGGQCRMNCSVANCASCSSPNYCSSCQSGYYASGGSCYMSCNVSYCNSCSSPNYCSSCQGGFYASGGSCHQIQCNVANCNSCSSNNYCSSCASGYRLSGGACVMNCNVANCTSCSSPNYCQSCRSGYYVSGGSCQINSGGGGGGGGSCGDAPSCTTDYDCQVAGGWGGCYSGCCETE